jgi:Flp pilus assembly protein TadG
MVMFTLMLPFVLVPMVGLAIDATMLFSVKAKLQGAVDGGALAAAQSLSSGLTFTAQSAAATKTADQFIKANFVARGAIAGYGGYWGSFNLNDQTCDANGNPTPAGANACIVPAQDSANKRSTVTIAASVNVPLIFMRILGFSSGTVTARGQAARRDVVMVLVLDRSSSMSPTIATLQQGATIFVNGFQSTRDRLGLVVFGGSAIVAYPPGDWNNASPTGPDTNFMTANPNMNTLISDIHVGTNTGTAEGLILAYKELQAANQPGALNVIVLFTDGQPNGITANFNGANPAGQGASSIKAASTCTYKNNNNGHPSMVGWLAQWGNYVAGPVTNGNGIFALAQWSGTSVTSWLGNESEPILASGSGQPAYNCNYAGNSGNVYEDLTIPTVDYYGNSTIGSNVAPYTYTDYQSSEIWGDTNECNNGSRIGGNPLTLTGNASGDACQVGLASWNAADMAGKLIHSDTTLKPVIYCMGYEGNGGDDPVLMERLANINVAANTVYNSNLPAGKYIQVQNLNDITGAFMSLAEEILRLSL